MKKSQNYRRCVCGFEGSIGTSTQFMLHVIRNHSHVNKSRVSCLGCMADGDKTAFGTPDGVSKHIKDRHGKILVVGHVRPDAPELEDDPDWKEWLMDSDGFLLQWSQMLVETTIAELSKTNQLSDKAYE